MAFELRPVPGRPPRPSWRLPPVRGSRTTRTFVLRASTGCLDHLSYGTAEPPIGVGPIGPAYKAGPLPEAAANGADDRNRTGAFALGRRRATSKHFVHLRAAGESRTRSCSMARSRRSPLTTAAVEAAPGTGRGGARTGATPELGIEPRVPILQLEVTHSYAPVLPSRRGRESNPLNKTALQAAAFPFGHLVMAGSLGIEPSAYGLTARPPRRAGPLPIEVRPRGRRTPLSRLRTWRHSL